MKVLGLTGSPRVGGNTEILVGKILEGAESTGAETRMINLATLNFDGCQACYYCRENGKCMLDDDMQELYEEVQQSDVIVLGSPIYMWQMSAQTKLFVDRLMAFLNPDFTSRLKGKKQIVLVFTQGQPKPDTFGSYIKNTAKMMEFLGFRIKDIVVAGGTMEREDIRKQEKLLSGAEKLGASLVSSR